MFRAIFLLVFVASRLLMLAPTATSAELTDEQRRRLSAGDVIVFDVLPPGASAGAQGGTALGIVRAEPVRVWRTLVDYKSHPRYYPRVTGVEVLESDERHALVRYQVGIGPFTFHFHMDKYPDPTRRRIEWRLAEGRANSLFRENTGYWQVEEAAGATLVSYAIGVRTVLPGFMTLGRERDSLVDTVEALRRLVEGAPVGAR